MFRRIKQFVAPDRYPLPPQPESLQDYMRREREILRGLTRHSSWHGRVASFRLGMVWMLTLNLVNIPLMFYAADSGPMYASLFIGLVGITLSTFAKRIVR